MLLALPKEGYSEPDVLASWIELTTLSADGHFVTYGDVDEAIRDSGLFGDPSNDSSDPLSPAGKLVATWSELERRRAAFGDAFPFTVHKDRFERAASATTLRQTAAYTSMLLIEAAGKGWYPSIAIQSGDKIRTLFEHVAVAAIGALMKGKTVRFGAPFPATWPKTFAEQVKYLAAELGIVHREGDVLELASQQQKDDSLDVVSRLLIGDEDAALPYVLVQCATGANWPDKAAEPTMDLWRRYINWNGPTYKALALPFAMRRAGELKRASIRHLDAIVFDRFRISAGRPDDLIANEVRDGLAAWCKEKFVRIPTL